MEPPATPVSAATARSVRKHGESHGIPLLRVGCATLDLFQTTPRDRVGCFGRHIFATITASEPVQVLKTKRHAAPGRRPPPAEPLVMGAVYPRRAKFRQLCRCRLVNSYRLGVRLSRFSSLP